MMKPFHLFLCALLATLSLASCTMGIKAWPEPAENSDKFSWRSVNAAFQGPCIVVEARLDGAFKNIETVYLELERLDENACAECPFKPTRVYEFRPGSADFELVGPWMKMRVCEPGAPVPYRLRLRGSSSKTGLTDVSSNVQRIDP